MIYAIRNILHNLPRSQYFRELFFKAVCYAAWVYIMFAFLWTICWLVGEILEKMGVG